MSMVSGLDLHREQITFDALETESGQLWRGRVWQPDRDDLWPALAHIARAFADIGRFRVAATILGRLDAGSSDLERNYHDFPLHDQLLAELGTANLATLLNDSQSQIADVAQLAIDTIDDLVN